jgi:hypothetical protein
LATIVGKWKSIRDVFCNYFSCVRGTKTFFRFRVGKFSSAAPKLERNAVIFSKCSRLKKHSARCFAFVIYWGCWLKISTTLKKQQQFGSF